MRKKLDKYVSASRRIGAAEVRPTSVLCTIGSKEQLQAVREWPRANGLTVSTRGRIPPCQSPRPDRTIDPDRIRDNDERTSDSRCATETVTPFRAADPTFSD